jgi:hypothetical protein
MDLELLRANLVRTLVPLIVGALCSLLPGLKDQGALTTTLGFAISALYYAVFRIAETRYPWLGFFLGKRMVQPGTATAATAGRPAASLGKHQVLKLSGVEIPGVESVTWSSTSGQPTTLTLTIRDADVELSSRPRSGTGAAAPSPDGPHVAHVPGRPRQR